MVWQCLSLSASLVQKISAAVYHICQITLNCNLFCKFEKWYKFSSRVEAKLYATRPACNFFPFSFQYKYILWVRYRRTTELQWKYILPSSSSSCSWRVRCVSCCLILKMKLVTPSLLWLSNVPSPFWSVLKTNADWKLIAEVFVILHSPCCWYKWCIKSGKTV